MKLKSLFLGALGLSTVGIGHSQVVIDITGATAFRAAATASIEAAFAAGGNYSVSFSNTDIAAAATTRNNGTYQAWRGTFPGLGSAIIRTSWNGSVEGVRALAVPNVTNNASFIENNATNIPAPTGVSLPLVQWTFANTPLVQDAAELAFSDVAQSSTPVAGTLAGGPVGVVVFTMVASKTWRDDSASSTAGLTNVTSQQFRALAGAGSAKLSLFSGNTADTTRVYLVGRNDGSGTRTVYLAETGFGISEPVRQYVAHDRSNTLAIPSILLTAKGGAFNFQNVATPQYASTVWNQDIDGNGGYSSGGDIRTDLGKTTASTGVWEFADTDLSDTYEATEDAQVVAPAKVYLLSWLTYSDARTARGAGVNPTGAAILSYNGAILPTLSSTTLAAPSTMNAADKAIVASGRYTAWSYQQLYHLNTPDTTAVFTELSTRLNVPAVVGAAGLALSEMQSSRVSDGTVVQPN